MPSRPFRADTWVLVADPPPCDPGNPGRAIAYCEEARRGRRCTCRFELGRIADDLEELGLGKYAAEFEDELDAETLEDLTGTLLSRLRGRQGAVAAGLRQELGLLQNLAQNGSGLRPVDEV
jgi:hypothetical protein